MNTLTVKMTFSLMYSENVSFFLRMCCLLWQNDVVVSWRPSSEFPGNV